MRSINLGVRVKQDTTLTVELPLDDPDAVVQMARGDSQRFTRVPSSAGRTFGVRLTAGDYVVVVDSTSRPSAAMPFRVTTSAVAAFWSAVHPAPHTDPRPCDMGIGDVITATDPKDPWPIPPAMKSMADGADLNGFLTSNSLIASTMGKLLDAY